MMSGLSRFKYDSKITKPKVTKKDVGKKQTPPIDYDALNDLNPSLGQNLQVLFIGFNPGVESSKTQHHYAHYTNLFWKLFNQSEILFKVLESLHIDFETEHCKLLNQIIENGKSVAKPIHDFDLIKYDIGFTDLVLRCTKTAQELTMKEKLDNVPRLFKEFKVAKPKKIVVIGKGIWEIIIKYIHKNGIKVTGFEWGKQENEYKKWMKNELGYQFDIFVFPNTSGLVTTMNYQQKLELWNGLFP